MALEGIFINSTNVAASCVAMSTISAGVSVCTELLSISVY